MDAINWICIDTILSTRNGKIGNTTKHCTIPIRNPCVPRRRVEPVVEAQGRRLRCTVLYSFLTLVNQELTVRNNINGVIGLRLRRFEMLRTGFIDPWDRAPVGVALSAAPSCNRFRLTGPLRHIENGGRIDYGAAKWLGRTPSHGLAERL